VPSPTSDALPNRLRALAESEEPAAVELAELLTQPARLSSAGYPYLAKDAWDRFRDHIPHLFRHGLHVLRRVEKIHHAVRADPDPAAETVLRACQAVRQVVMTAAVTAAPDLWLLRHVLGTFDRLHLLERWLDGDAIYPHSCQVEVDGRTVTLSAPELEKDLHFLLSRGLIEQYEDSFRIAGHPRVSELFESVKTLPPPASRSRYRLWAAAFSGETLSAGDAGALAAIPQSAVRPEGAASNHWVPSVREVEIGYLLVPLVLGLRAADLTAGLSRGASFDPAGPLAAPKLAQASAAILHAAGWVDKDAGRLRVTALGERGFARGPGPFGIIETYHAYMAHGVEILLGADASSWVRRSDNVAASQDANYAAFRRANDALDRFCADTGFHYQIFIEHAVGRGEGIRQRYERDGDSIRYFGADLEDAAIEAAREQQSKGRLPADIVFVSRADIGKPAALIDALVAAEAPTEGAVMLVGNGFHEVRDQARERMVAVLRGYHEAGILLLFTEENALSIDDLRATAWNTFHAGFAYVHEKSGQALRPADPSPPARLGKPLRTAWKECALEAGYIRAEKYCTRSRTIYPYPPASGINPAISENHFFIPGPLAEQLGLADA
jgi:hypothetical protein